jgi:hypothetical protein
LIDDAAHVVRVSASVTLDAKGRIAPGRRINARLAEQMEGGWGGTYHGELDYGDLNGDRWMTRFSVRLGEGNQIVVEHEQPERERIEEGQ